MRLDIDRVEETPNDQRTEDQVKEDKKEANEEKKERKKERKKDTKHKRRLTCRQHIWSQQDPFHSAAGRNDPPRPSRLCRWVEHDRRNVRTVNFR